MKKPRPSDDGHECLGEFDFSNMSGSFYSEICFASIKPFNNAKDRTKVNVTILFVRARHTITVFSCMEVLCCTVVNPDGPYC